MEQMLLDTAFRGPWCSRKKTGSEGEGHGFGREGAPSSPSPALTFPHSPAFCGFTEGLQVRIEHLFSSPSLSQCI